MKFHKHDCDCCVYLGSQRKTDEDFDYYFCKGAGNPTVIARFGDCGDYYSSLYAVKYEAESFGKKKNISILEAIKVLAKNEQREHPLFIAANLAIEKDLLNEDLSAKNKKQIKCK